MGKGRRGVDQQAHPYKTWFNNGVGHEVDHNGTNITPRNQEHTFEVKETSNNTYRFLWDGNAIGQDETVTIDNSVAVANANSERGCEDDSLWATFDFLKRQSSNGGNWNLWTNISTVNFDNSPYRYCSVSDSAFDVKQSC